MKNAKKLTLSAIVFLLFILSISTAYASENNIGFSLMYHELCTSRSGEASFTITASTFEADIKYLSENGFEFYFASEMDDFLNGSEGKKGVVITFDDGYESGYTMVLPILEKYNAKATFFVIGKHIDTPQFFSSEQLKLLSESPLVEIGNHSNKIHGNSSDDVWYLYSRDAMSALDDFKQNAAIIEGITAKKVTSASYPYGIYTDYLNALMNYSGFTTYSSDEASCFKGNTPYPRYNRTVNSRTENLIRYATSSASFNREFNYSTYLKNSSPVTVYENGTKFDGNVIVNNGVTMLPAKFIAQNLNAYAKEFEYGRKIKITKNDKTIILSADSYSVFINDVEHYLPEAVFYQNGELYAPARFLAEELGAEVNWDAKHQTVLIY